MKKMDSPVGYSFLILAALLFCGVLISFGFEVGVFVLVAVVGLPVAILCIVHTRFGFFFSLFFGFVLFLVDRLLAPVDIPMGLVYEIIIYLTLAGIILKEIVYGKSDWSLIKHPVFILLIIWTVYQLLQILNPNAVNVTAYVNALRGIITRIALISVCIYVFKDLKIIKDFTKFWLFFCLLAALYGFKQELFGFYDFEIRWIFSDEMLYSLMFNWGRWRIPSFMSDVSVFGMIMAFAAIVCFILALGPYEVKKKVILIVSGILMLCGMTFSGTRTAYAMVPAGFLLYIIMTITDKKTIAFAIVSTFAMVVILFGPFYSPNVIRLRSILEPNEDPSMQVRNVNRARIQPYIFAHPIGGGLLTTGNQGLEHSPGHPLAGFQTDSGYLETALETGWIGLVFELSFFFMVLFYGTKSYFRVKSVEMKTLLAAYLCAFFALAIANYAQPSIAQKPLGFILYALFVIVVKIKDIDDAHEDPASIDK